MGTTTSTPQYPGPDMTLWPNGWSPKIDGEIPLLPNGEPISFPTMAECRAWCHGYVMASRTPFGPAVAL